MPAIKMVEIGACRESWPPSGKREGVGVAKYISIYFEVQTGKRETKKSFDMSRSAPALTKNPKGCAARLR